MVELDKFANTLSRTTKKLLIAWSNVTGKTKATVLTIFDVKDIIDLTSIIVDDKKKTQIDLRKKFKSVNDFPELYQGAMSELGHILGSNYISAIGDLLGIRLMTDPPDINLDTGKQLFSILKDEIGLLKKLSLVINTSILIFSSEYLIISCSFLIPKNFSIRFSLTVKVLTFLNPNKSIKNLSEDFSELEATAIWSILKILTFVLF